jgi:hypothetical protein
MEVLDFGWNCFGGGFRSKATSEWSDSRHIAAKILSLHEGGSYDGEVGCTHLYYYCYYINILD